MKRKLFLPKMFAIAFVIFMVYSYNSFAQNTKSAKDKKKSHTEYVQLKIEKDDNGKITKVDTIFSSSISKNNKHMKSCSINIPDFDDEFEKSIESINDNDIDPFDFFKNFQLNANDSFVDFNIVDKIRIECNGKEGNESVRIFACDDDESWVEKIYNKTVPGKKREKQKTFIIKIDDDGVEINGEKEEGFKDKKSKIIMSKIIINDASKDKKKKVDGKDAFK